MAVTGLDLIVLAVADVARTCTFYETHLGITVSEDAPGKWALRMGAQKINLQPADGLPEIARNTKPGTANLCLLWDGDVTRLARTLRDAGIEILAGPGERLGAGGPILSIYFHDPDGNLVEVGQPL